MSGQRNGDGLHRAKLWQIAGFAFNNTATNMYMYFVGFISYFMIGALGVGAVLATSFVTVMRIWDGVSDPFVGYLVDKTNGRFGKNRPFMLIGNLILMISTFIMFYVSQNMPSAIKLVFFVIIYMIYVVGYTFQCVVTKSAQSCLTNDPKQRPLYGFFTGFFMLFLTSGVNYLISNYLVPKYGGMTYEFFNELIIWVISIAFVLMVCAFIAIAPKDKPEYYENLEHNKAEKVGFKVYWEILKKNRALQMLIISECTDKLAMNIAGNSVVGVMLFGIIIGNYEVMGRLSVITMIPNIVLLVFGILNARQAGQKRTYVLSTWLCIILQAALGLIFVMGDPTKIDLKSFGFMNVAFVVLYIALNGIRNIGSNMMIPMMADCTDYEIYRSGHFVPGLVATIYSFVDKLISSFGTTIVGLLVAAIGYKNAVPQIGEELTPSIFAVTMLLYCGMPIIGWVISIVAMKFYPLDGEKMREVEDYIADIKEKNISAE